MGAPRPPGSGGYVPQLPPEYVAQVQRWHERAYQEGRAKGSSEQAFAYLGLTLVVPPEVMPITPTSHLLGEAVLAHVRQGDRVLDVGTGSGVNAVLAASRGATVLAVDTNRHALEAARANAARNGVAQQVEVRHSDVFSAVDGVFDLIVFDPPFRWFRPRDQLETAMTDEDYRAMTEFFRHAYRHLARGGKMLVFFGTSGDLGYLTALVAERGFSAQTVARDKLTRDGWGVEYFTFLIT